MKKTLLILIFITSLFCKNILQYEESPYLKQHSTDPINWVPFKNSSFEKAKKEKKLIFLSIGYSTCHWCHVMQKESFKDEKIASILNNSYVSIKLDKEEMPHIDTFYQNLHIKINKQRKAWPLTLILDENKDILFVSTYIPKEFKYEVEGLETILPKYANLTKEEKKVILLKNKELIKNKTTAKIENSQIINEFLIQSLKKYDKVYHGFERTPKFPLAINLDTLLNIYSLNKDENILKIVTNSLNAMKNSALFDQVEGGFFRYSTLPDFSSPHFEKMLYNQGELISLYTKAYKITANKDFLDIAIKTLENTNNFLKSSTNLYFSASDADSLDKGGKRVEGFYFLYKYQEAYDALSQFENVEEILEYLSFEEFGNFQNDLNIVYLNNELKKPKNLQKALDILKDIRNGKSKPFIDEKIITSWNAIMINAIFDISFVDKKYLTMAKNSLNELVENLYVNKILYHQKYKNNNPNVKALLEDYSLLTKALLNGYDKTYNKEYLDLAILLNEYTTKNFYSNGVWYLDEDKHTVVDFEDRYYQSAIGAHFDNNLTISNLLYDLKKLENSKKYIEDSFQTFSQNLFLNPGSVNIYIRLKKGDIILKSSKENLLKNRDKIVKINYPYLLTKVENTDKFLACDEKTCFNFSINLDEVINAIDKN